MIFRILTLFPEIFTQPQKGGILAHSVMGKALQNGLWDLEVVNVRDFAQDVRKTVDDKPIGGGAGMVLRPDVLFDAIEFALKKSVSKKIIYLSPRGQQFTQKKAVELNEFEDLVILCGRYEGIDQRIIDEFNIEEVSLGDFVLSGGEIPAFAMMDAILRLKENVLGASQSLEIESFSQNFAGGNLLEHNIYTKPNSFRGKDVPEVLLSGNHAEIEKFKLKEAEEITKARRPDLWRRYLDEKDS